jgi:predicted dehydrogenase
VSGVDTTAGRTGRVGVGVIGAGVISGTYLENMTQFADLEVLFVADLDLDRAKAQAETYGVPGHGTP